MELIYDIYRGSQPNQSSFTNLALVNRQKGFKKADEKFISVGTAKTFNCAFFPKPPMNWSELHLVQSKILLNNIECTDKLQHLIIVFMCHIL